MTLHASLLTITLTAACSRPCVTTGYINDHQFLTTTLVKINTNKGLYTFYQFHFFLFFWREGGGECSVFMNVKYRVTN